MLPTIPFGKVGKINNSKAVTSRLFQASHQTMVSLGIVNKAGKKRILKDRSHRRYLYEGSHKIPCFNLKFQEQPVLLAFKFIIYRTSVKIYIEAKMLMHQENGRFAYFINRNRQLILELSERMAIKYMCMCENDFAQLVESHLIIANNQLKIEKATEYLVSDVHSTRGYFAYADDVSNMSNTMNSSKNINFLSRLESTDSRNEDETSDNLKLLNQDSSFKFSGMNNIKPDFLAEQKIQNSGVSSPHVESEQFNVGNSAQG